MQYPTVTAAFGGRAGVSVFVISPSCAGQSGPAALTAGWCAGILTDTIRAELRAYNSVAQGRALCGGGGNRSLGVKRLFGSVPVCEALAMRILVKRGNSLVNDLHFTDGPIYVGRRPGSHVYLPDRSVSRQHAVLFTSSKGSWIVQDLESSNRTTVQGRPIAKMPLREGDVIGIADFLLEVRLDNGEPMLARDKPLDLGDTVIDSSGSFQAVQERAHADHPLHIAPDRLRDFYELTVALGKQDDEEALLAELIDVLIDQFKAWHVWSGLRELVTGPLTCYGGRINTGEPVSLERLIGRKIVKGALDSERYILLPSVADATSPDDSMFESLQTLRSAMAAPIIGPNGAYGVIYIDNAMDQTAYTPHDLDYLALISITLAALVERVG